MPERPQVAPGPLRPEDHSFPSRPLADGSGKPDDQGVPLAVSVLVIAVVLLIVSAMG